MCLLTPRIRLATYNVNDKLPPPGTTELAPLVGDRDEDVLVFGFQEIGERKLLLLDRADKLTFAVRLCSTRRGTTGQTSGKQQS